MLSVLLLSAAITVSPSGGVKAFEQARDQVRQSRKAGTITLQPGDYLVDHTVELDAREPAGTVYRAAPGVRWIGGVRLAQWRPVQDTEVLKRLSPEARSKVLVHDVANLGAFQARGFGRAHLPAHSELFFQGARMTVARWPNDDFARIAESLDTEAPDDGHGKPLGRLPFGFRFEGDRPASWAPDANIWVHGYWSWDWADSYERVVKLDPKTRELTTAEPHGLYGFRKGQRYYFLNVLEELDKPGEYYLDAKANRVYFWPPSDPASAEVFLSQLDTPIFRIRNANRLTLDGFTIEATRGTAIEVEGGSGVTITNAKIRNVGNSAVIVNGGKEHSVLRSELSYLGDSAVEITGGDRTTLASANHRVADCDIHHMGQWVRTYNPAVKINGVGNHIAHNHIHDAPHAGIIITGNNHLIQYNNIHHLALETGDVGAIYIGRDYTERGTYIRFNYIHELGGVGLGSMAVYLDDCASGINVFGNIFYKVKYGAFIGGGRDNIIQNNVFISASPAVHVDARCIDPKPVWHNMVYDTMKPKVLAPGPFLTRYPDIRDILPYLAKNDGVPPEGNYIRRNLIYGDGISIRQPARPYVTAVAENTTLTDITGFDPATGSYVIPESAPHTPIPFKEIGPRPAK